MKKKTTRACRKQEPMVGLSDSQAERIRSFCVNGLCTDGAHHKQWFLASILREVDPSQFEGLKRVGHNMGMPP